MSKFFSRPVSRRQLLGSAVALATGASVLQNVPLAQARPRQSIEVLTTDVLQDAPAFGRGRHLGTSVRNGSLTDTGVFESEVLTSPFAFTHVGLHWLGNSQAVKEAKFEMRTSEDGSQWSDWQLLHLEALPEQTPVGETYASLVYAPRHTHAQYRAVLSGGASVNRVTATFLNSQDGPTIEALTTASLVNPGGITYTRGDWGCDESLRFDRRGREIWPRMYVPVKKLVIHHTATRNTYTLAEAAGEVRAIYTYHAKTLGWGDIGYNVLIDQFGKSFEGRYSQESAAGREIFGPDVVAGHALAYNYGSCGAALIGNFESTYAISGNYGIAPTKLTTDELTRVLAYRATERNIDPLSNSNYLLSDGTWKNSLANVCVHSDCNSTLCPGDYVEGLLGTLQSAIKSQLGTSGPAPLLTPGQLDGGVSNPSQSSRTLSYSWSGPVEYCLEGWSKTSTSEAVTYLRGYTVDKRPDWQPTNASGLSFSDLADGHYTMHVRTSASSYETNQTVLIKGVTSGGGGKPRGR